MVQTKKGNPVHYMPYTYLMNEDLDTWTQSHNGGRCYGAMTTNMSQCFNGVLKGAHGLPIVVMVEFTWRKLGANLLHISTIDIERLLLISLSR